MKKPDPKACAEAEAAIANHAGMPGDYVSVCLHIDQVNMIRDALRFCARKPDSYVCGAARPHSRAPSRREIESVPAGLAWYACYRLEESDDA